MHGQTSIALLLLLFILFVSVMHGQTNIALLLLLSILFVAMMHGQTNIKSAFYLHFPLKVLGSKYVKDKEIGHTCHMIRQDPPTKDSCDWRLANY
jgi:hypothetical protein